MSKLQLTATSSGLSPLLFVELSYSASSRRKEMKVHAGKNEQQSFYCIHVLFFQSCFTWVVERELKSQMLSDKACTGTYSRHAYGRASKLMRLEKLSTRYTSAS